MIPLEVSNKHLHLCREDIDKLFGKGYELTKLRTLSHEEEFAAKETVKLFDHELRVVGPARKSSQLELSETDARKMKLKLPLRISGDVKGAPLVEVKGPEGSAKVPAIIAKRHLHCCDGDSEKLNVKDGDIISVKIPGESAVTFHNVVVRVSSKCRTALHINTDEGNAAGIKEGMKGIIVK